MKDLRLKKEFEGMIITRNHMLVGNVTFDSTRVDKSQYKNFQNIFSDLFEEVELCDVCSNEGCICQKEVESLDEPNEDIEIVKEQVKKYTKKK
jgi:hypothetical protein